MITEPGFLPPPAAVDRIAAAFERLARLPDAVSQLARAVERVGDQIELACETIANRIGPPP